MSSRRYTALSLWRAVRTPQPDWPHVAHLLVMGVDPGDSARGETLWTHLLTRDPLHLLALMAALRTQSPRNAYLVVRERVFSAVMRRAPQDAVRWTALLLDDDPCLLLEDPSPRAADDAPATVPLLHLALRRGWSNPAVDDGPIVGLLLDRGAVLEAFGSQAYSGWDWAMGHSVESVERALEHPGIDLQHRASGQQSLLHLAVPLDHAPVLQRLIEGGVPVDAEDLEGRTALYRAVVAQKATAVRVLLTAGADPNHACARSPNDGTTALHQVATQGDVYLPPRDDRTPPHRIVVQGASGLPILDLLLAHGGDPHRPNAQGDSPVDLALRGGWSTARQRLEAVLLRDTATGLSTDATNGPACTKPVTRPHRRL